MVALVTVSVPVKLAGASSTEVLVTPFQRIEVLLTVTLEMVSVKVVDDDARVCFTFWTLVINVLAGSITAKYEVTAMPNIVLPLYAVTWLVVVSATAVDAPESALPNPESVVVSPSLVMKARAPTVDMAPVVLELVPVWAIEPVCIELTCDECSSITAPFAVRVSELFPPR